jgi:hypothetical protein
MLPERCASRPGFERPRAIGGCPISFVGGSVIGEVPMRRFTFDVDSSSGIRVASATSARCCSISSAKRRMISPESAACE